MYFQNFFQTRNMKILLKRQMIQEIFPNCYSFGLILYFRRKVTKPVFFEKFYANDFVQEGGKYECQYLLTLARWNINKICSIV